MGGKNNLNALYHLDRACMGITYM